jgi:hypothetical protein
MIAKEEARNLAMKKIPANWGVEDSQPLILDEYTIEKDFGWGFFYDSQKHIETGEFKYMIAGNAPIIVNRFDSSLHFTGTAYETEHYIKKYEESLKKTQS